MNSDETVKYYKELMLYQYQLQAKATSTIDLLVRQCLCDLIPLDVQNAYDIDDATGPQLDIIGKYVGLSRQVAVELPRNYWRLVDSTNIVDPTTGLTDSVDISVNLSSVWYKTSFAGESFYTMTDSQYQTNIKLKILLNNSDNSLKSIAETLFNFFGLDLQVFDGADMTLNYTVGPLVQEAVMLAYQLGLLPKPQGVGSSGVYKQIGLLFAFADSTGENGNTTGFSDSTIGFNGYHWLNAGDKLI
jgi:hypothetical protein